MRLHSAVTLLGLLAAAAPARAGVHIGNGGDVVVCERDGRTTVELLDFYEARLLRRFQVALGGPEVSVADKVAVALARWEKVDAGRAALYREWARAFEGNALFLTGVQLEDIPDSGHDLLERGCHIEQIAIHREPSFPQDSRYLVSQDLWDRLDNDGRAGLILHEVIYREAVSFDAQNSIGVRYLNSLAAAGPMETLPRPMYADFLRKAGIHTLSVGGLWLRNEGTTPSFWPSGALAQGDLLRPQELDTPWGRHLVRCRLALFEDGQIQALSLYDSTITLELPRRTLLVGPSRGPNDGCGHHPGESGFDLYFEEPGQLHTVTIDYVHPVQLDGAGFKLFVYGQALVSAEGEIYEGRLVSDDRGTVEVRGARCETGEGKARFFGERPTALPLKRCDVPFARQTLRIYGDTDLAWTADGHAYVTGTALDHGSQLAFTGLQDVHLNGGGSSPGKNRVGFDERGVATYGVLDRDAELTMPDGTKRVFMEGLHVEWNPDGTVKSWYDPDDYDG